MNPTYQYNADLIRVIDGDSIIVSVDLGFRVRVQQVLRLYGINAPELVGESRAAGIAAKDFLTNLLPQTFVIKTFKDPKDKYGRWLAELYLEERSVNMIMVEEGHAKVAMY